MRSILFLALALNAAYAAPTEDTFSDVIPPARVGNDPMPLYLVPDNRVAMDGAVCLDGTNPGYYFQPAPANASAADRTSWVLYFKGGGWCYDEASCALRAKSQLGSSKDLAKTFAFSGPMDSSPAVNPDFANFNRVVMWYCDGASFSGNNDTPYVYQDPASGKNQTLYFRGARVLGAILDTLKAKHGLGSATQVLLSGGSAGGLSTFLHADRVHGYLRAHAPALRRFKAAPVSGFFLLHATAQGAMTYPDEMAYVYRMQNATAGLNTACIASFTGADGRVSRDAWRCIFANYSYAHTAAPMFPLQSAVDAWQMGNVWQNSKGNACIGSHFQNCTAAQVGALNGYAADLVRDLQRAKGAFEKPGNGGFVESCLEHCGAQGAAGFDGYVVRNTTMQRALSSWWHAAPTESAAAHWYLPCKLTATAPHQCNPTC